MRSLWLGLIGCTWLLAPAARSMAAEPSAIYRCETAGRVTFSDRPCSNGAAELVTLGQPNTVQPPQVPPSRPKKAAEPRSTAEPKVVSSKQAEQCARMAQALKEIKSKLRSGYTTKQGERLKQREAKLKQALRGAQCS